MKKRLDPETEGLSLGRLAYHKDEIVREKIRGQGLKAVEAAVNAAKTVLEQDNEALRKKYDSFQKRAQAKENISESAAKTILYFSLVVTLFLIVSAAAEYFVWLWTVQFFNFDMVVNHIVAGAMVSITILGYHFYLYHAGYSDPQKYRRFLSGSACIAFVSVLLLIIFFTDIRQALQQTLSSIGMGGSAENTVKAAEHFYNETRSKVTLAMIAMGFAFVFISGMSFHYVASNLPGAILYLKMCREMDRIDMQRSVIFAEIASYKNYPEIFVWHFEKGLMEEEKRQRELEVMKEKRKRSNHVITSKAVAQRLSGPIFLVMLALGLFILFQGVARGEYYNFLFLDLSGSTKSRDYSGTVTEFEKNYKGITSFIKNHLGPGDTVKLIAITETSFSRPYILIEDRVSDKKGAFGETLARDKIRILKKWEKFNLKPTAKATDIFGAINLVATLKKPKRNRLIIFSDMRQCADGFNFEKPKRIDVDKEIQKALTAHLIPELEHVRVWCLGVHSVGKTPAYWMSLKTFWEQYFKISKAVMMSFSMGRELYDE